MCRYTVQKCKEHFAWFAWRKAFVAERCLFDGLSPADGSRLHENLRDSYWHVRPKALDHIQPGSRVIFTWVKD
jgi:hypothetical protein